LLFVSSGETWDIGLITATAVVRVGWIARRFQVQRGRFDLRFVSSAKVVFPEISGRKDNGANLTLLRIRIPRGTDWFRTRV
jgi:hypothetical protein